MLSVAGDVLTIDGVAYDFSAATEDKPLTMENAGCEWLVSDVTRIGGELHLTLILPHGARAPQETLFPAPLTVTKNGPVKLPEFNAAE